MYIQFGQFVHIIFSRHRGPNIEGEDQNNSQTDDDVEMDENIAAMVLTSLSCSPVSPHFHGSLTGIVNGSVYIQMPKLPELSSSS